MGKNRPTSAFRFALNFDTSVTKMLHESHSSLGTCEVELRRRLTHNTSRITDINLSERYKTGPEFSRSTYKKYTIIYYD